jgi:hypothetical protein
VESTLSTERSARRDFLRGLSVGPARTLTLASLVVFLVTGALALLHVLRDWPGGAWPWTLALASFLMMVAFLLNFDEMRRQRDQAITALNARLSSVRHRLSMQNLIQAIVERPELDYRDHERQVIHNVIMRNASWDPIEIEFEEFRIPMGDRSSEPLIADRSAGLIMPSTVFTFNGPRIDRVRITDIGRQDEIGQIVVRYRHASQGPWFRYRQRFSVRTFRTKTGEEDSWGSNVVMLETSHEEVE